MSHTVEKTIALATFDNFTAQQTMSFATLPTVGAKVIVLVQGDQISGTGNVLNVTDNQGNAYTKDTSATNSEMHADCWFSDITTSAGTFTVRITPSGGTWYGTAAALSVTGLASGAKVASSTNTGNSAVPTTGTSGDSTQAGYIAVTAATTRGGAGNANEGFANPATFGGTGTGNAAVGLGAQQDSTAHNAGEASYKDMTAQGTVSASWGTLSTSDIWAAQVTLYKDATSGSTATPGAGSITLSGKSPLLGLGMVPGQGTLTLTGYNPSLSIGGNTTITPNAGAISLSGLNPTLTLGLPAINPGSLTLQGYAPSISTGGSDTPLTPSPGSLAVQGYAPAMLLQSYLTPNTGTLGITGFAPQLSAPVSASPSPGVVALTGFAPSLLNSTPTSSNDAGRKKKARKRYYLEIDGVRFDVRDAQEAQALLDRAKALATAQAERQAQQIIVRNELSSIPTKPVSIPAPEITVSPELERDTRLQRNQLTKVYADKSVDVELRLLLELQQRLEDDDAEAILLLQ